MAGLWRDLVHAARAIRRRQGMAALVALVVALGIGATTTVFAIADAFLLRGLPFPAAERLLWLQSRDGESLLGVSHADAADWNDRAVFEGIATFDAQNHAVVSFPDGAESLLAVRASSSLFTLLGVPPWRGRTFSPAEDQPGAGNVAILSYDLWRRRFGGADGALGAPLEVDGLPHQVIGVMPPGFDFPSRADLWVPASSWADQWPYRNVRVDSALARLADGVGLEAARARLDTVSRQLAAQYPDTNTGIAAHLLPLREVWSGASRAGLLLVLGAGAFLLLIACANAAALLLVWAGEREREVAVRMALGAPPGRLLRQMLVESLLLAVGGGAGGLLLSFAGVELAAGLLPERLPGWLALAVNLPVALFAAALSLGAGLLFGLAPTLRMLRVDAAAALGQAAGRPGARRRAGARRALVLAQITIALTLAVGAGLFARSFAAGRDADPGYGGDTLTFQVDLSVLALESYEQVGRAYGELLTRLRALPGIEAAGATTSMPLARKGTWDLWDYTLEGQDAATQANNPRAHGLGVSQDYFRAMAIAVEGRALERGDAAPTGARGAVVSRSLARHFWPGGAALGKRLKLGPASSPAPYALIVGIADDVRFESAGAGAFGGAEAFGIYLPLENLPSWPLYVALRGPATGRPESLAPRLREAAGQVSLDLGVHDLQPMAARVEAALWRQRLWAILFGTLAALALVLAGAGVYGVIAQLVQSRAHEIGIRLALGAGPLDIARTLIGESLRLLAVGLGLGLALSLVLARLFGSRLAGPLSLDPLVFLAAAAAIALMALLASSVPVLVALRVAPAAVLKAE